MSNTKNQTATERAEALLTRWEQRLSQSDKQTPPTADAADGTGGASAPGGEVKQPKTGGRGVIGMAARVYVAVAAKTGELVDPVTKTWQASVDEARREQEQKAARTQGAPGAQQEGADEKKGEQDLKKTAGAATEAAGTAAGA